MLNQIAKTTLGLGLIVATIGFFVLSVMANRAEGSKEGKEITFKCTSTIGAHEFTCKLDDE
jgi:hypothetical protein